MFSEQMISNGIGGASNDKLQLLERRFAGGPAGGNSSDGFGGQLGASAGPQSELDQRIMHLVPPPGGRQASPAGAPSDTSQGGVEGVGQHGAAQQQPESDGGQSSAKRRKTSKPHYRPPSTEGLVRDDSRAVKDSTKPASGSRAQPQPVPPGPPAPVGQDGAVGPSSSMVAAAGTRPKYAAAASPAQLPAAQLPQQPHAQPVVPGSPLGANSNPLSPQNRGECWSVLAGSMATVIGTAQHESSLGWSHHMAGPARAMHANPIRPFASAQ